VVLVAVSMALTLALAEFGLRLAMPTGYFIWKPRMERTFHPAPEFMPGVTGVSTFRTNSQGLRADELTGQEGRRILALGGSTTECLYLDQSEAWPRLLQDLLNADTGAPRTWVGNAGMSGRNSRHHVLAMRHLELQSMKIDTVLVLSGINDLSIRLSQGNTYDPDALLKPEAKPRLLAETFLGLHRVDPAQPWFRRMVLWQLARSLKARLTGGQAERGAQDDAGSVYDEWRRHRQMAGSILRELPDMRPGLQEYERNLREIVSLAREKSVRPVFITQPTMWRAGLPTELERLLWFGGVGDFQVRLGQPYYAVDVLADAMKQYNDVMLGVCASEKVDCIDPGSLAKDTSVFYDDVHFNESGSRQLAALVAEHLRARPGPLPR
jgi:lysophospholipase L1-like esterase